METVEKLQLKRELDEKESFLLYHYKRLTGISVVGDTVGHGVGFNVGSKDGRGVGSKVGPNVG
jgi:hypothetical protein